MDWFNELEEQWINRIFIDSEIHLINLFVDIDRVDVAFAVMRAVARGVADHFESISNLLLPNYRECRRSEALRRNVRALLNTAIAPDATKQQAVQWARELQREYSTMCYLQMVEQID